MATALAAVRLQRPHHEGVDAVHKYMETLHGMRELGSSGVSVRAFGGYLSKGVTSQSRGRVCRVPLFRTSSSPRREALISAMSEEHDITDMQETDKVSGEWWKPILTAVHDWSQEKLLGLAELADGSLFFSFGPGSGSRSDSSARPAKASPSPRPKAQGEANKLNSSSTHNNPPPKTLPQRHPSSFRKHSPIPATRKTGKQVLKEADDNKPKKTPQKAKDPTPHRQRPPSAFSKRSPIPKDRVKQQNHSTEEPPAIEAQAQPDSPFSPELKEILDRGKQTADKESAKSNQTLSAAAPGAKKKASSKISSEDTVVEVASSGASVKKKTSRTESEETVVEVVPNGTRSKDLGSYKLPELRSLAKSRGLKGYSKLKKGELLDLLAGLES